MTKPYSLADAYKAEGDIVFMRCEGSGRVNVWASHFPERVLINKALLTSGPLIATIWSFRTVTFYCVNGTARYRIAERFGGFSCTVYGLVRQWQRPVNLVSGERIG